jgi:acyl carrier protein
MGETTGRSPGDDEIERTLIDFVERSVVVDGARVAREERLVESGRVDSIGLLQILGFVAERYEVDLLVLGSPRDLLSVAALAAAIRREAAGRDRRAEGA